MTQTIVAKFENRIETLELPHPKKEITEGVCWGDYTHLFTPACWKVLSWIHQIDLKTGCYQIGENLKEEISACLLGGYGIPSQVGLAAFYHIKETGMLEDTPSEMEIRQVLNNPLTLGKRKVRYRFVNQKAKFLSAALKKLSSEVPPDSALEFRAWLTTFDGIGYKTASWITRNWLQSDEVAIIDIHIHRAGILMNLYNLNLNPSKNYLEMEERFLHLAEGINVRASLLDVLIWQEMKYAGKMALRHLRLET